MAEKRRVLFVNQELEPYLSKNPAAGQLARQVAGGCNGKGGEVRIFMPNYGLINERRNQLHEVIRLSGANISINDNDHPLILKVASLPPSRIQVYFIDNDDYFQKEDSDSDPFGSNRADNDERAIFFAHGTVETVRKLKWEPHIVHASGWVSALVPLYMRKMMLENPAFASAKTVYTVTPDLLEAPLDPAIFRKLSEAGVLGKGKNRFADDKADTSLLHKLAIAHSDAVVFATPEPDPELVALAEELKLPALSLPDLSDAAACVAAVKEFHNTILQ